MDLLIAPGSVALAQADQPPATGTPQFATDGIPPLGFGTQWPAYWFNTLMLELVGLIQASALTPDRNNAAQVLAAIQQQIIWRQPFPTQIFTASQPGLHLATGWYGFRLGGAGGGGGGATQTYSGSGGGASGGEMRGTFHVDVAGVFPLVCGVAGLGGYVGSNAGYNGLQGGSSSFLGLSAGGGSGGISADDTTPNLGGGGNASPAVAPGALPAGVSQLQYLFLSGNDGGSGTGLQGRSAGIALPGDGSAGFMGGAGRGGENRGIDAHGPGAGGGGAFTQGTAPRCTGGSGGSGYLVLETFAAVTTS